MENNIFDNEKLKQIQTGASKTRKELVDYVLNCTEEELFEMCDVLNSSNIRVTSWSCEECQNQFFNNDLSCDGCDGIEICLEYFVKMDKTEH